MPNNTGQAVEPLPCRAKHPIRDQLAHENRAHIAMQYSSREETKGPPKPVEGFLKPLGFVRTLVEGVLGTSWFFGPVSLP